MQWAIANGEKETGITLMYMDEKMDTGDIIDIEKIPILDDDDLGSIHDKMSLLGSSILEKNFSNIINNLKINTSMAYIGVIMGELLVSKKGLGYLIMYGSQVFNINLVITSVFLLGVFAFLFYYVICLVEKKFIKK